MGTVDPILVLKGVEKEFPGVKALDAVDLEVRRGEVHALVGENGAGKSTLIKVIAGIYRRDGGTMVFDGKERDYRSPAEAGRAGISVIHQETSLIGQLTALQNVFLGMEGYGPIPGVFDTAAMERAYRSLADRLGVVVDPSAKVRDLGVAEKKLVEIMKALARSASLIIMDEPTDSLTEKEMETLFEIIGDLKAKGITLVYITHYLEEVFRIADRITVLKDGRKVATLEAGEADRGRIVSLMVGTGYSRNAGTRSGGIGREVLRLENLTSRGCFRDVSLTVHAGEILGVTGVIGSGKTELARAVFGADRIDSGTVFLDGRELRISSPADALAHGIGMMPEDRKTLGLILDQSVKTNVSLSSLNRLSKAGLIDSRKEEEAVRTMMERLSVKAASIQQRVKYLSGGNQQKLIIAKWLIAGLRILIMDEPTRGIDIGSKQAIYRIMRDLADRGTCILFISSEIPEIVEVCDRILVMKEGGISCEFAAGVRQEEVMHKALEEEAV